MTKRRLSSLLPAYHQTPTLVKFFGATVDALFQPGTAEPVSGFVGRKPSYYDPEKDFYITEPSAERARYQLEPGMVSYDANKTLTHALTYPDLISYLRENGARTDDHARLFETDYYSWAPPINIDMLVNYHQYYWFGDEGGDAALPILDVYSPVANYTGDGVSTTFALPASVAGIPADRETPCAVVDGVSVACTVVDRAVHLDEPPAPGSKVTVFLFGDLRAAIEGRPVLGEEPLARLDLTGLVTEEVGALSSGMRIRLIDGQRHLNGWGNRPWDTASEEGDPASWDVEAMDGVSSVEDDIYFVDGVGQSIRLTPNRIMRYDGGPNGTPPQYITIDRSSRDRNGWSLRNFWVHREAIAWASGDFRARQARRPIIEFIRDLVLMDGQEWQSGADPLFVLYDLRGNRLDSRDAYPGSNFAGSRVFGYAEGSGAADAVLHRPLKWDQNGYILFSNDIATVRYSYASGEITGMYAVGVDESDKVRVVPNWYRKAEPTTQTFSTEDGLYDIPLNLQANPNSLDIGEISRSDWVDHFRDLIGQQDGFAGSPLASNNFRDTPRDLRHGTQVLQHQAPMLKLMLLASDRNFDFPAAILHAEQEYNRFRNRFARRLVELLNAGAIDQSDIPGAVTTTLMALRVDRNPSFPFANSTMAGGQYFIPPTPAALGVLPCYKPGKLVDTSYGDTPVTMLRGHDGSLTPAFGDWRDDAFMELEQRIYDNIPASLKTEARPVFDLAAYMGNRFQHPTGGYDRAEVQSMLAPIFERWAQTGRFDFRTNGIYNSDDPFTWNYRGTPDLFGDPLPGHWRAIYRWYFDTDRPDLEPWAMLGFADKPDWWEEEYGTSYGRDNAALWADLEAGIIRRGPRAGTDPRYARPHLSHFIPVDRDGVLLDPVAAQIVPQPPTQQQASAPWEPGDHGPAENLWINSPSYRFALAQIAFLMKPARFVEQTWDTVGVGFVPAYEGDGVRVAGDQWVALDSMVRPSNAAALVHGETKADGTVHVVTGIQQWVVDALVSYGQKPTMLGDAVRGLDVRLIHKMAGFVSAGGVKAVADNFGLLPSEDMQIALYNSPSVRTEVYSGVVVEWTGRSYRVVGYDARDPFFRVLPPDINSPKGVISLSDTPEPAVLPWRPNTFYSVNAMVEHQGSVYKANRSHTSGTTFEVGYWTAQGALPPQAPRVITYLRGESEPVTVPYGSEFGTIQEVADFLLGYERYLVSRGWVFDILDPDTQTTRNWSHAVREFLGWSQVQWDAGNFIALSPGAEELKFRTETGTVLDVEDSRTGFFGLTDRSGLPIQRRKSRIARLDGEVTMTAQDADIFGARVRVAEIEHALIFSNVTIFNDAIYLPLYNMRQARLRLTGQRTRDWAGRLDAPGFMLDGENLLPNFEKAAEDVRLMFDIEKADRPVLRDHARHVIGYQARDYLERLLLSETEQFEFYQGMIASKGSPGVFQTLLRSQRVSDDSDLAFLEEWAFRINRFGAPRDPRVTLQLRQIEMRRDPQVIRFSVTAGQQSNWIELPQGDTRWLDAPSPSQPFFRTRTGSTRPGVPTAGPVRLSEVQYTAFRLDDLPDLYTEPGTLAEGERVWVYDQPDYPWTVLRVCPLGQVLAVISAADDPTVVRSRIVFREPHGLTEADIGARIVVDGLTLSEPDLAGVQVIYAVDVAGNWIEVGYGSSKGHDFTDEPENAPEVRILRSVRYRGRAEVMADTRFQPAEGDLAWVNGDTTQPVGIWAPETKYMDGDMASYGDTTYRCVTTHTSGTDFEPQNWEAMPWAVLRYTDGEWRTARVQPQRMDPHCIAKSMIYTVGSRVVDGRLMINEPLIDHISVIDATGGILPGVAARELDYCEDYDPAGYNHGAGVTDDIWTGEEVGRLWWDLSTVRFIDPYTDAVGENAEDDARLGLTPERVIAEIDHRALYWNAVAPGSSVDVYEWVRSDVSPAEWMKRAATDTTGTYEGTVYKPEAPSWSEEVIYDPRLGRDRTIYYFWVKGRTSVPNVPFRRMAARSVAIALENPSALDLPWLAPIAPDAMLISGVAPVLNDVSTVLKVEVDATVEGDAHSQWLLLRPKDERSLPPDWLWRRIRDGLAAFDDHLRPLPYPGLHRTRATGILEGQNIFAVAQPDPATPEWQPATDYNAGTIVMRDGTPYRCVKSHRSKANFEAANWRVVRDGLMAAREAFVTVVNTLLSKAPVVWDRSTVMGSLERSTPINEYLIWVRPDQSYSIEPPPEIEYTFVRAPDGSLESLSRHIGETLDPAMVVRFVASNVEERNRLLASPDFIAAADSGTRLRILMDNTATANPQWSIWEFDPAKAANAIQNRPEHLTEGEALVVAADEVLSLAKAYEYDASDDLSFDPASGRMKLVITPWAQDTNYAVRALVVQGDAVYRCNVPHNSGTVFSTENWTKLFTKGDRVYVSADPAADGFWTIRRYDPQDVAADGDGFILHRVQTYRTTDFWEFVDWYAPGYSPDKPPMYVYSSIAERNRAEGSKPTNQFVKIENDGTGHWAWTIFNPATKGWQVVAREKGTVTLSSKFYDASRVVHGLGPSPSTATVANRDGSWEMRALVTTLRFGGLLTDLELNVVFFSLVYFIHSQQEEVDWAFKTSFMTIAGYHEELRQTPVQTADPSESLISYVGEVKPYRVKLRDFSHQYSAGMENARVHATDFDKPVWYDPRTQEYRRLDPNDPVDRDILAETAPWLDWFDEYTKPDNGVRKIKVKMLFDRLMADPTTTLNAWQERVQYAVGALVEHLGYVYRCIVEHTSAGVFEPEFWEVVNPLSAADRIIEYFNPPTGSSIDLVSMLKTDYKADIITGAALYNFEYPVSDFDTVITGFDTVGFDTVLDADYVGEVYRGTVEDETEEQVETLLNPNVEHKVAGLALNDPYVAAGRPEEQTRLVVDDAMLLSVKASALPGGPVQAARVFDTAHTTAAEDTFFFGDIAQSNDAIFVYRDGIRAVLGTDYTIDFFGRTATVKLDAAWGRVAKVLIHSFGISGRSLIREQHLLASTGATTIPLTAPAQDNQVYTTLDGVVVVDAHTNGTSTLTLPYQPGIGADLAVTVFEGSTDDLCAVQQEVLSYNAGQEWRLRNPDRFTIPEHAGTIVEVDGVRLTPPRTFYGRLDAANRWITTDRDFQGIGRPGRSLTADNTFVTVDSNTITIDMTRSTEIEVFVNGVPYTNPIPIITEVRMDGRSTGYPMNVIVPPDAMPPNDGSARFVIYDRYLIALNNEFMADEVIMVVREDYDYDVHGGVLSIYRPLTVESRIVATTFANADMLGIRTYTYSLDGDFEYSVRRPHGPHYGLVAVNGRAIAPEVDFSFADVVRNYDEQSFGDVMFDQTYTQTVMTIPMDPDVRGVVVATLFSGRPARESMAWLTATTTPAANRMMPAIDSGGFDTQCFSLTPFDLGGAQRMAVREEDGDPLPLFEMEGRWENIVHSPLFAGRLAKDFNHGDATIEVVAPEIEVSDKLRPAHPLALPDLEERKPGVVWINGERIEYFSITETDDRIILGELRRGTQGTSAPPEYRKVYRHTGDGSTTVFTIPAVGVADVLVNGVVHVPFRDYVMSAGDGQATISFTAPPAAGAEIIVGITIAKAHPAGTAVINGTKQFTPNVPVGPAAGIRDDEPMRTIIAG